MDRNGLPNYLIEDKTDILEVQGLKTYVGVQNNGRNIYVPNCPEVCGKLKRVFVALIKHVELDQSTHVGTSVLGTDGQEKHIALRK